jgi:hypothetical protein
MCEFRREKTEQVKWRLRKCVGSKIPQTDFRFSPLVEAIFILQKRLNACTVPGIY